jgi:hypothetical protein
MKAACVLLLFEVLPVIITPWRAGLLEAEFVACWELLRYNAAFLLVEFAAATEVLPAIWYQPYLLATIAAWATASLTARLELVVLTKVVA